MYSYKKTEVVEAVDSVSLTKSQYISLLLDVESAYKKFHTIREEQIAEWKNDNAARFDELKALVDTKLCEQYHEEYEVYKRTLKRIVEVPRTFLQRFFCRVEYTWSETKDAYGSTEAYAAEQLRLDGTTYYEYFGKVASVSMDSDECWRGLLYMDSYAALDRTYNPWSERAKELVKEVEGIKRGQDAIFTISREKYDSYTRSLTIADVGLCEQAYAPMRFRSIYI